MMNINFKIERVIILFFIIITIASFVIKLKIDEIQRRNSKLLLVNEISREIESIDFSDQEDNTNLKKCAKELAIIIKETLYFGDNDLDYRDIACIQNKVHQIIRNLKHNKIMIENIYDVIIDTNDKTRKFFYHISEHFINELKKISE